MPKINELQGDVNVERYSLATPMAPRGDTAPSPDGLLINLFVEKLPTGDLAVTQRPGMRQVLFAGGGTAQGCAWYNSQIYYAVGNTLSRVATVGVNSASSGATWTQNNIPTWAGRLDTAVVEFKGMLVLLGGADNTLTTFYN